MNLIKSSLALFVAATLAPAQASSLDNAQTVQSKTNSASVSSQKRINKSADNTLSLTADVEQLQEEVKNLEVYQSHLTALIENQQQEVSSIDAQIQDIKYTRQGVVPLMYQMVEGLKEIVANDSPLKKQQREERIAKLESLMTRADVSDAEKYRRILEAYQIELDYGTKLGVYQGQITVDGEAREADILHLGRVSLVARSLNGNHYWAWQRSSKDWQALDASNKSELDKAYSIAANHVAPSLITLPVSLTKAEAK
ncbi:DUF3450 domain-containing protein [Vibrio intestinalis]|uniref:DUF3450 domain-containing protein n=1 Tax=Vibrio intestinalis TaxID=2933291 RepID=UPI0021A82BD4|nr:DUF3450 domain-containing protein [Vibrio intestinalis]